mmetsp:Transcript_38851/g.91437  ORF Transcript_38851/g.91437 Transcript_38851/m.91437 type:complete len:217 (-) Transcript_38851:147-797(-)
MRFLKFSEARRFGLPVLSALLGAALAGLLMPGPHLIAKHGRIFSPLLPVLPMFRLVFLQSCSKLNVVFRPLLLQCTSALFAPKLVINRPCLDQEAPLFIFLLGDLFFSLLLLPLVLYDDAYFFTLDLHSIPESLLRLLLLLLPLHEPFIVLTRLCCKPLCFQPLELLLLLLKDLAELLHLAFVFSLLRQLGFSPFQGARIAFVQVLGSCSGRVSSY